MAGKKISEDAAKAAERAAAAAEAEKQEAEKQEAEKQEAIRQAEEAEALIQEQLQKQHEEFENEYNTRLARHMDELKWLYCELYGENEFFGQLLDQMKYWHDQRSDELKKLDHAREVNPSWYRRQDNLGMQMYTEQFSGTLQGLKEKLDYIESCKVNFLHLMPLLDSPEGRSDGGYAVADFRKVRPDLGTIDDLEEVCTECRRRDISVCLDFVMNHTSEDHEWAKRARNLEKEYMDRYFFYDSYEIPAMYERTVPQVFPTTAPGNFTWLEDIGQYVLTSFYPYQWDLNYRNPVVFNEMAANILFLANKGIDMFRIDAVPYIWKTLGTDCRNLPEVHTIVRMIRMISEIVCPAIIFLGEVVMEPVKVVPYFGTLEKPECHLLYNVTTMCTTWHTVATKDVRLLRNQIDILASLPKDYLFLNYLRCHDDIGWGLDYNFLKQFGINEADHKKYVNDYLTGNYPGSYAEGELYNNDPVLRDARLCGTTASLCGIERAQYKHEWAEVEKRLQYDVMLHAFMLTLQGFPIIYSGDELVRFNDYSYKDDPHKVDDSRYVHRGKFPWEDVAKREDPDTIQGKFFSRLMKILEIRDSEPIFADDALMWTIDTWDDAILGIMKYKDGRRFIGLFNFSDQDKTAWIDEGLAPYRNMIDGTWITPRGINIPGCGFMWLIS